MNARASGSAISGQNMKKLAREYAEMTLEERAAFKDLGHEATALHRAGRGSFASHSRRAKFARSEDNAPQEHVSDRDLGTNFVSCEDAVMRGEPASLGHNLLQIADFERTLSRAVRREADMIVSKARQKKQEELRLRRRFQDQSGRAHEILADKKRLADVSSLRWTSFPHPCEALAAEFNPDTLVPKTWAQKPQSNTDSSGKMAGDWQTQHIGVATPAMAVPKPVPQKCYDAHVCSCGPHNQILRLLHSRLRQILTQWREDGPLEQAFSQGRAVLHWSIESARDVVSEELAAMASSSADPPEPPKDCEHWFTLVPLYYLRPWRVTLAPLAVVQPDVCKIPPISEAADYVPLSTVSLTAMHERSGIVSIIDIWRWLDRFAQKDEKVAFELFTLSQSSAPCADLLEVVAVHSKTPPRVLWRGRETERGAWQEFGGAAAMWEAMSPRARHHAQGPHTLTISYNIQLLVAGL